MAVDNKADLEIVAQVKGAISEVDKLRKEFVADAEAMKKSADQVGFDKSVESAGKLKAGIGDLKGLLVGLGAAAAAIGLKNIIEDSIGALIRQENAIAQVEARLRSTGGAAGLTSKELQDLAASMQDVTTFGDEAVLEAEALLLTFTKIGKGTFPAATEATLNMAQAMGTDLKSAALQVGKALNDPVLGVTALSRAGVQFSKDQREVIKSLVETGQTAKAQALILAELETQMGGAARAARDTLGGSLQSLKNVLGDLQETFAAGFAQQLSSGLGDAETRVKALEPAVVSLGKSLGFVATQAARAIGWLAQLPKKILPNLGDDATAAVKVLNDALAALQGRLESLDNKEQLVGLVTALSEIGSKFQEVGQLTEERRAQLAQFAQEIADRFAALGLEVPQALINMGAGIEALKENLAEVPPAAEAAGGAVEQAGEQIKAVGEQAAAAKEQVREFRVELTGSSDKGKELAKSQGELADEIAALEANTARTVEEDQRLFDLRGEMFTVTEDLRKETERYQAELLNLSQAQSQVGVDAALLVEEMKAAGYSFEEVGAGALQSSEYFGTWNENVKKNKAELEQQLTTVENTTAAIAGLNAEQFEQIEADKETLDGLRERQREIPAFISALEQQTAATGDAAEAQKEASKTQAEGIAEVNALLQAQVALLKEIAEESDKTREKMVENFKQITAAAELANKAIAA